MTETSDRPILVVGSGRSGTTALYEILCRHPDLGWFSNYTDRWPSAPQLAAFSRLWGGRLAPRLGRLMPIPSEGYRIWDRCIPPTGGPLPAAIAGGDIGRCVHRTVRAHLRFQGKRRFINKNTRNTVRIEFLEALFEEPVFVHVLRDPRATVASLLKVAWWPDLPIWCLDGITPAEWAAQGRDPVELAARLWVAEVGCALEDARAIPAERYVEIKYEDLIARPREKLVELSARCGLRRHPTFERVLESVQLDDRNHKFRQQLSPLQIAAIEKLAGDLARSIGYELSDRPG